jgi:hypothetical protein
MKTTNLARFFWGAGGEIKRRKDPGCAPILVPKRNIDSRTLEGMLIPTHTDCQGRISYSFTRKRIKVGLPAPRSCLPHRSARHDLPLPHRIDELHGSQCAGRTADACLRRDGALGKSRHHSARHQRAAEQAGDNFGRRAFDGECFLRTASC